MVATTSLIREAEAVMAMDDARREWRGGQVRVEGSAVKAAWAARELPADVLADEAIDARGRAVLPGLVNTHHPMAQSRARAIPATQDAELFAWLKTPSLRRGAGTSVGPHARLARRLVGGTSG